MAEPAVTVLNVDDSEANRCAVNVILQKAGYRVLESATGEEALQIAARERPEVIILDIDLPGIDGFEVCRRVKANPLTASCSVIHLTASRVSSRDKVIGLDGGADAFLREPVGQAEILATVASVLRVSRAERTALQATIVRDNLLAVVAHDLKSPLSAASLSAQVLLSRGPKGPNADAVRRHAELILRCTHQMDQLVRDLLDLAKIRGNAPLQIESVSMESVLREQLPRGKHVPIHPSQGGGSMTTLVLYVDDDEAQRIAIRRILLGGGFRILEAKNGEDAIALLDRSTAPDLAVLDLRLPDMDGHELARRIRARTETVTVPVVFLTSRRLDASDRVTALSEGADGCLQLPITSEEMLATIRSVLRLRRADKAARESVAVREDLLALVSHDLKNPLAALLISVTLLEASAAKGAEGDLVRRQAGIIERSASRMDRLISDLADLAWIESGRLTLTREHLSAEAVLREALDAHQGIAVASGVTLAGSAPGSEMPIFADRHRLSQVLANLIANAIKFSPPEGTVTVSFHAHGTEGKDVTFRVRDAGPGIPAADHDKLFDRFWQAAATSEKGTGLGLSIAKAIVEAHGGTIRVESKPGSGSTFSFTIPDE